MKNKSKFKIGFAAALGATLMISLYGFVTAQSVSPSVIETDSHIFTKMADGVYQITGTGKVYVMSNAMMVVGAEDVLIVDSHVTPNAANALVRSVAEVTDKPIRYLVNSHYHFDHAHGNQVFPHQVEIIGHSYTRQKLSGELGNVLTESTHLSFTEGVPALVEQLKVQVAQESDPVRKAQLQINLSAQQAHMVSIKEVVPTPPNITMESELSVFQTTEQGSREIRILHLGRSHTAGDVVVYLPQEKIVFTGDMMIPFLSYMGDSFPLEWIDSLEALKNLDYDFILPGHGLPLQGTEKVSQFQGYIRDLWDKTATMKASGLSIEDTAAQIDMRNHAGAFPQLNSIGADVRAVRRIYALLDQ